MSSIFSLVFPEGNLIENAQELDDGGKKINF